MDTHGSRRAIVVGVYEQNVKRDCSKRRLLRARFGPCQVRDNRYWCCYCYSHSVYHSYDYYTTATPTPYTSPMITISASSPPARATTYALQLEPGE